MTPADIPLGMRLKDEAGWNQTEADWRRLLALAPAGCFVACVGGQGVGTAVAVVVDGKAGWLAMVLVLPEYRRRGIGTALLQTAMRFLEDQGIRSIKLDATPLGKKVYDRMGFVEEYGLQRRQGQGRRSTFERVTPLTDADWADVLDLDTKVYGVHRGGVLRSFHAACPHRARVYRHPDGRLLGYLFVRPGSRAWHLAPWAAVEPEAAVQLLRATLNDLADEPVFFDVPGPNRAGVALAEEYGFSIQRPFIRMFRGENPWPGRPEWVYATSGPEKG